MSTLVPKKRHARSYYDRFWGNQWPPQTLVIIDDSYLDHCVPQVMSPLSVDHYFYLVSGQLFVVAIW